MTRQGEWEKGFYKKVFIIIIKVFNILIVIKTKLIIKTNMIILNLLVMHSVPGKVFNCLSVYPKYSWDLQTGQIANDF